MSYDLLRNISLDEIEEFLKNDDITNIDWNGQELWIDDLYRGRIKDDKKLSKEFINNFTTKLANEMNTNLNNHNPYLEAETENLRISIYHESVASTGRSISIRKTPTKKRLNRKIMLETDYCPEEICNFMENAIKAHCSVIICGLPAAGKTEYLKSLTEYIPPYEKVATIEDSLEIHYKSINPGKDCVELKVTKNFPFEIAIASCLRHNIKWTLLSESRGKEVLHLMNNLSNGTYCMTTIHANDVRKIPDRMANMIGDSIINERFINNVYSFLDIGVKITSEVKNGEEIKRKIDQVCVYSRENEKNVTSIIYEYGTLYKNVLPENIKHKFNEIGITDPFKIKFEKGITNEENTFVEAI